MTWSQKLQEYFRGSKYTKCTNKYYTRGLWLDAITRVLIPGIKINKRFQKVGLMTKIILFEWEALVVAGRAGHREYLQPQTWETVKLMWIVIWGVLQTQTKSRRLLSDRLTHRKQWLSVNHINKSLKELWWMLSQARRGSQFPCCMQSVDREAVIKLIMGTLSQNFLGPIVFWIVVAKVTKFFPLWPFEFWA